MKKLINILLITLTPLLGFAQSANITWGGGIGAGMALFTNATSIELVDASFNSISHDDGDSITHNTTTLATYVGVANASGSYNGLDYSGQVFIKVNAAAASAVIGIDSWSLSGTVAPAAPQTATFSLKSNADLTGLNVVSGSITTGTNALGGADITVVPEPSTYALIAGFIAFVFVALQRRKA